MGTLLVTVGWKCFATALAIFVFPVPEMPVRMAKSLGLEGEDVVGDGLLLRTCRLSSFAGTWRVLRSRSFQLIGCRFSEGPFSSLPMGCFAQLPNNGLSFQPSTGPIHTPLACLFEEAIKKAQGVVVHSALHRWRKAADTRSRRYVVGKQGDRWYGG